ncbi:hypothetical protein SETIT_9G037200v2 [Setaria italica]|uniref:Uncharacterized protein n=1 Tax=Setaria italica TaxID=4555 RepID=A0A368SCZ9_SETIT|nr:hypothetical protein SETIT_9G037200v2 [Setaria italica]
MSFPPVSFLPFSPSEPAPEAQPGRGGGAAPDAAMAECRSLIEFLHAFEHHRKAEDSSASASTCSRSRRASSVCAAAGIRRLLQRLVGGSMRFQARPVEEVVVRFLRFQAQLVGSR